AALADAPVHDLLQVVAAGEMTHLGGADALPRVSLDEHPQELSDLVDVVARLPLGNDSRGDLARGHGRVERARGQPPAPIAHRADDAEVAELQARAVAHEHVHRRQVAVEELPAVELPEHLEDAGDLTPCRALRPRLPRPPQVRAEVAVAGVLEGEAV